MIIFAFELTGKDLDLMEIALARLMESMDQDDWSAHGPDVLALKDRITPKKFT